jgi:hypothetical protein
VRLAGKWSKHWWLAIVKINPITVSAISQQRKEELHRLTMSMVSLLKNKITTAILNLRIARLRLRLRLRIVRLSLRLRLRKSCRTFFIFLIGLNVSSLFPLNLNLNLNLVKTGFSENQDWILTK